VEHGPASDPQWEGEALCAVGIDDKRRRDRGIFCIGRVKKTGKAINLRWCCIIVYQPNVVCCAVEGGGNAEAEGAGWSETCAAAQDGDRRSAGDLNARWRIAAIVDDQDVVGETLLPQERLDAA